MRRKTRAEKKKFMQRCLDHSESEVFDLINYSSWNGQKSASARLSSHTALIYKKNKINRQKI